MVPAEQPALPRAAVQDQEVSRPSSTHTFEGKKKQRGLPPQMQA